jgi:hypothetical protein
MLDSQATGGMRQTSVMLYGSQMTVSHLLDSLAAASDFEGDEMTLGTQTLTVNRTSGSAGAHKYTSKLDCMQL